MKYITFSRSFPVHHPRFRMETYFVEKICNGLCTPIAPNIKDVDPNVFESCDPKWHTIRENYNWRVGETFSPRVWSGRPYQTKQLEFTSPITIKKIFTILIKQWDGNFLVTINGREVESIEDLAKNDGLSFEDFKSWFSNSNIFMGQILCWNENINY